MLQQDRSGPSMPKGAFGHLYIRPRQVVVDLWFRYCLFRYDLEALPKLLAKRMKLYQSVPALLYHATTDPLWHALTHHFQDVLRLDDIRQRLPKPSQLEAFWHAFSGHRWFLNETLAAYRDANPYEYVLTQLDAVVLTRFMMMYNQTKRSLYANDDRVDAAIFPEAFQQAWSDVRHHRLASYAFLMQEKLAQEQTFHQWERALQARFAALSAEQSRERDLYGQDIIAQLTCYADALVRLLHQRTYLSLLDGLFTQTVLSMGGDAFKQMLRNQAPAAQFAMLWDARASLQRGEYVVTLLAVFVMVWSGVEHLVFMMALNAMVTALYQRWSQERVDDECAVVHRHQPWLSLYGVMQLIQMAMCVCQAALYGDARYVWQGVAGILGAVVMVSYAPWLIPQLAPGMGIDTGSPRARYMLSMAGVYAGHCLVAMCDRTYGRVAVRDAVVGYWQDPATLLHPADTQIDDITYPSLWSPAFWLGWRSNWVGFEATSARYGHGRFFCELPDRLPPGGDVPYVCHTDGIPPQPAWPMLD